MKQMLIWIGALAVGAILGLLQVEAVDVIADFVATVYTRLFRLLAVPTIVLGGNLVQFFLVLPLFLLLRGLNPVRVFSKMYPATLMALFSKSSAATLPVTMQCAEQRLQVEQKVARFVLPICTTINMVETAVNVWSDSCVCAMTDHDLNEKPTVN